MHHETWGAVVGPRLIDGPVVLSLLCLYSVVGWGWGRVGSGAMLLFMYLCTRWRCYFLRRWWECYAVASTAYRGGVWWGGVECWCSGICAHAWNTHMFLNTSTCGFGDKVIKHPRHKVFLRTSKNCWNRKTNMMLGKSNYVNSKHLQNRFLVEVNYQFSFFLHGTAALATTTVYSIESHWNSALETVT